MQPVFLYVFPMVGGLFSAWFPGGLQLTFCITATLSGVQAKLINSAMFRKTAGVQPLPKPANPNPIRYQAPGGTPPTSKTPEGTFGGFKSVYSDMKKKYSQMAQEKDSKERLTEGEQRYAKTYEQRRQKEMAQEAAVNRNMAQVKFERAQEQRMRDQERQEALQRRTEKKARRRE